MGIKKITLALLSGFLLGFSQEENGFSGLLVLFGYLPILGAIQGIRPFKTGCLAFLLGILQYGVITSWLYETVHYYLGFSSSISLGVFIVFVLISASFTALAFALSSFVSSRSNWPLGAFLPAALCGIEYIRLFLPAEGMSSGSISHSLTYFPLLIQTANWVGEIGLLFFIVVFNILLFNAVKAFFQSPTFPFFSLIQVGVFSCFILGYGQYQLSKASSPSARIKVGLLQTNLNQLEKKEGPFHYAKTLSLIRTLHKEAVSKGAELVVWPEAVFPFMMGVEQTFLPLNLSTASFQIVPARAYEGFSRYNSVFLVDAHSQIRDHYNKVHLMPFGEYTPPLFALLTPPRTAQEFSKGTKIHPLAFSLSSHRRVKLGIDICIESIFPTITRSFVLEGANLMIATGNEMSLGSSRAHREFLKSAIMRAVENGRSFARVVDSGFSAFIDKRGRISQQTLLNSQTVIVKELELNKEKTFYTQWGDVLPLFSLFFLIVAICKTMLFTAPRAVLE